MFGVVYSTRDMRSGNPYDVLVSDDDDDDDQLIDMIDGDIDWGAEE